MNQPIQCKGCSASGRFGSQELGLRYSLIKQASLKTIIPMRNARLTTKGPLNTNIFEA